MPANVPLEYVKAEEKFLSAKTREDKIAALEEMIRLVPKHHGSENLNAQLKARLARLKKEVGRKRIVKKGIQKEGEAQICLVGFTNSGKSTLLSRLTNANPLISEHEFTTTRPEIGMMDYNGVKVQLVEIPSTFAGEYVSIARSCDAVALVIKRDEEKPELAGILKDNFIRTKSIFVNPWKEDTREIKRRLWDVLGMITVYSRKTGTTMALPDGSTVKDFCARIHKDFIKNFRFARLWRHTKDAKTGLVVKQIGLDYILQDGDVVEIHVK